MRSRHEAQVDAAEIALVRARRLLADRAGSQRDVDDAVARVEVAKKGQEAAQARKQLLDKLSLDADTGQLTTIPVVAPRSGILRTVSSSVGQTVSAGAPLFEVVSLDRLWVRVPVYPGLREEISRDSNALIRDLGTDDGEVAVKPVAAPPSADPLAATIDLFYEVANADGRFFIPANESKSRCRSRAKPSPWSFLEPPFCDTSTASPGST